MNQKYLAYLSSSVASIIGGCSFIFSKMVMSAGLSFLGMLFWRMLVAAVLMLALYFCGRFPLHFRGKPVGKAILASLFYPGFGLMLEMLALNYTTAAEVSTMAALIPVVVMVLSRLIFREEQTGKQRVSVIVSVMGVIVIVFADSFQFSRSYVGYLILLAALCCDSCYNIATKGMTKDFTNTEVSFIQMLTALGIYTVMCIVWYGVNGGLPELFTAPFRNPAALIPGLLFLGVANSVLVTYFNSYSIRKIGPTRHTSFYGLITLTTVVMSRWVLHEQIQPVKYLGMALIIAGAWGANHFRKHLPEDAEPAAEKA